MLGAGGVAPTIDPESQAMKTKVRMLTIAAGPGVNAQPGDVVEVEAATAKEWIEAGNAEPVDAKGKAKDEDDDDTTPAVEPEAVHGKKARK